MRVYGYGTCTCIHVYIEYIVYYMYGYGMCACII